MSKLKESRESVMEDFNPKSKWIWKCDWCSHS